VKTNWARCRHTTELHGTHRLSKADERSRVRGRTSTLRRYRGLICKGSV